jgi:hypothetical protein
MKQIFLNIALLLLLTFPSTGIIQAQDPQIDRDDQHTAKSDEYFTNLNNQFILRLFSLYKANNVDLRKDDMELRYRPNGTFNIGLGFNYKFLGLSLSYGIPASASSKEKYGNTQRLDLQISIFSKVFAADGLLQVYRGYYIQNPGDFVDWKESSNPQLPDMQVVTLGINAYYLVNHKKFSYRAAFMGNQVQNKSAGSIAAGIFGTFDQVRTYNGFIPPPLQDSVTSNFDLKSFEALTVGLSVGYMYTFVLGRGFFIALAAVPGLGYRQYKLVRINGESKSSDRAAFHMLGRISAGYNHNRYFVQFKTLFNIRNYQYDSYEISLSTEQLRLTIGMRFQTKASKKRGQCFPD